MSQSSKSKNGEKDPTGPKAVAALIRGLERKQDRLAEQLRPLLAEYRATQAALASLRQMATPSNGGIVGRRPADELPRLPKRELAAIRDRARQLAEARALEGSGVCQGSAEVARELGTALRLGSLPYLAREVLRSVGQPLHAVEILERLNLGGAAARRGSLVTALARLAADRQLFYRVDSEANTFGLLEWLEPPAKEDTPSVPPSQGRRRP